MFHAKIWESFIDIIDIFCFRMKLIRKDIITLTVLLSSIVVFAFIIRSLTISSEDLSSLPIGVVDYDNSDGSLELIQALKQVKTLRIIEGTEEKLQKLLLDEMITSVFIIEDDYEKKLNSGNLVDILSMRYKEDNKSASIISDIVAAEILSPACFYKSYQRYEQLPYDGKKLTLEQYGIYMEELIKVSGDFNFAFRFNYINPTDDTTGVILTNTVLYLQFICGILGMMMTFIAMFLLSQTIREKESGVELRLRISKYYIIKRDLGNLFALLVWEGILSILFTGLVFYQLGFLEFKPLASFFLLLLLNSVVLGGSLLLVSKFTKRMLSYQIISTLLILFTGGLGFYGLISGFYQDTVDTLVKFIPNSWFIKGLTDIIIYDNAHDYFNEGHRLLLNMAVLVILLIIGIDLVQELYIIKCKKRIGR